MIMLRMVCGVFLFMLCFLLSACGTSFTDYAKQTTIKCFPHVPIGKALDNYFEDTDWAYRGEDKKINPKYKHLVVFYGIRDGKKEYIAFGSNDGKKYEVVNEVAGQINPNAMYDEKTNEPLDMNIWFALKSYRVQKGDKKGDVDKYIEAVKKTPIKNLVIGDAQKLAGDMTTEAGIKLILDNDKWNAFNGEDGEKVVEVTGIISDKDYTDEHAKKRIGKEIVLQFLLDDNNKVYEGYSSQGVGFADVDIILPLAIKNSHQLGFSALDAQQGKSQNLASATADFNKLGYKETILATSYGHSSKGFLSRLGDGTVVLLDKINNRAVKVSPASAIEQIVGYQGSGKRTVRLELTIYNDGRDSDAANGAWMGNDHLIPVTVEYNYENGQHIPYMIKSGSGASPASYDNYLYEQKNVDAVNMIIEEAAAMK